MDYIIIALLVVAVVLLLLVLLRKPRTDESLNNRLIEMNTKVISLSEDNSRLRQEINNNLNGSMGGINKQLTGLYETLGKLQGLADDVEGLSRTISGVKTRGIWGEGQLRSIIEEVMLPSQYDGNVITKPDSKDPVEFAIRLPEKATERGYTHLPIDSKFPADIYDKLIDALENCDKDAAEDAKKELRKRVLLDAKTINEKYILTPYTTDYAVMFLPTEGLYAEVLRINGLCEECRSKYGIIIAGPMNMAALLASFKTGFANIEMSNQSRKVVEILGKFKEEYKKFSGELDSTRKSAQALHNHMIEMQRRNQQIGKVLDNIGEISAEETDRLLAAEEE